MLRITYVGHATVLLEQDGTRLLTDPLLRGRVLHLRRRPQLSQDFTQQQLSAVLISHTHQDHFDLPSLERLRKDTLIILPEGVGRRLRQRGFQNIRECSTCQEIHLGSLVIQVTTPSGNPDPLGDIVSNGFYPFLGRLPQRSSPSLCLVC